MNSFSRMIAVVSGVLLSSQLSLAIVVPIEGDVNINLGPALHFHGTLEYPIPPPADPSSFVPVFSGQVDGKPIQFGGGGTPTLVNDLAIDPATGAFQFFIGTSEGYLSGSDFPALGGTYQNHFSLVFNSLNYGSFDWFILFDPCCGSGYSYSGTFGPMPDSGGSTLLLTWLAFGTIACFQRRREGFPSRAKR